MSVASVTNMRYGVNRATEEAKIIVDITLGGGCSGSEMKLLGFFRFGGAKNES